MYILGIDPGPIPGVCRLQLGTWNAGKGVELVGVEALQVSPGLIEPILDMLTRDDGTVTVAIERFVVGNRAGRSATASAGNTTRDMVGMVTAWASTTFSGTWNQRTLHSRSASEVKPWATDKRLQAAGLLDPTHGMRHARDAARHALFCAVKDHGLPDPLSVRGWSA
jgi:hypothetical protein